jgi:thioredoxin-related protein
MLLPIRSTILRVLLSAALVTTSVLAQSPAANTGTSAEDILSQLKSQASAEHKSILITFGASWCGNCHLFDKFLADPTIHPILDKAFVFADLASGEREGDKHHANTPGAEKLETLLGGKDVGVPFIVMLDASGNSITNSLRPVGHGNSDNIGYPDASYEIDWFIQMLNKAAPTLTLQDSATIRNWLNAHSSSKH